MSTTPPLEVIPLTVDRFDDLVPLFNEGGDPKWCWCAYWRVRARDFAGSAPSRNRERLRELAQRPNPPGLVAYLGDRVVGWVSLGPRDEFERLEHSKVRPRLDDVPVWSIVCFVVSKRARGQGIARALLDAAIEHARAAGAPALEAYPVDTGDERVADNMAYTGALSMFRAAGFAEVRSIDSPTSTVRRVIARRDLAR